MRNPFRSEADAFRVAMMIVGAGAVVIAATVLVGSWLGVVLGLIAILIGAWATIGWLRVALGERDEDGTVPRTDGGRGPGGAAPLGGA